MVRVEKVSSYFGEGRPNYSNQWRDSRCLAVWIDLSYFSSRRSAVKLRPSVTKLYYDVGP